MKNFNITRLQVPLPSSVLSKIINLWTECFGIGAAEGTSDQLAGRELQFNQDYIYCACKDGILCGTCHLTIFAKNASGGLGEVAVHPEFRKMGLGEQLCRTALNDFDKAGGRFLFLGTTNSIAAKLYRKLGFRFLPGSTVMLRAPSSASLLPTPEQKFQILPGDASFRIPVIPLVLNSRGIILDANASLAGCEYFTQHSCMGLYGRYQGIAAADGLWIQAMLPDGTSVGAASRIFVNKYFLIDFFTLPDYLRTAGSSLLNSMLERCKGHRVKIRIALQDLEKFDIIAPLQRHSPEPCRIFLRERLSVEAGQIALNNPFDHFRF